MGRNSPAIHLIDMEIADNCFNSNHLRRDKWDGRWTCAYSH